MFNPIRPFEGSWDQIWPTRAFRGPRGPPKEPFRAKSSPFRAPWGPEGARYQVKVCFDHESNSGGPIGGSWDQIWLPAALRGPLRPPKGSFGVKTSPFRVPWGPEGARYQVKVCVDHESNSGQLGAVGTKSGSPPPSFWSQNEPFWGPKRSFKGPRHTVCKCFCCHLARLGCSRGSEGAKRGPKNENIHILAVLTPQTAPGAVVIKT